MNESCKSKDVLYRGEVLTLTVFFGRPCLFIKKLSQISMPKMRFVGGYPDEYCVFPDDLTDAERRSVTDLKGRPLNPEELLCDQRKQ